MLTTTLFTIISTTVMTIASLGNPVVVTENPTVYTKELPASQITYYVNDIDTDGTIAEDYHASEGEWKQLWNDHTTLVANNTITLLTESVVVEDTVQVVYAVEPTMVPTIMPTTAPTTDPVPTVTPVDTTNAPQAISEEAINYLGQCEAGMDPAKNTGNGYYGAFQFSYGTWQSMNTGYERADLAPLDVQKDAVQRLLSRSSIYTQFPGCARKMAAAGLI